MDKEYVPTDYSQMDVHEMIGTLEKQFETLKKLYPNHEYSDLMFESNKRKAKRVSTDELSDIIKEANRKKRNTFDEPFIVTDLKDDKAVISFEGGHMDDDDTYPGCLKYETEASVDKDDIHKLLTVSKNHGIGLSFKHKDVNEELHDFMIARGFEEDESGYSIVSVH